MKLFLSALGSLLLFTALPARSQSPDSSAGSQSSAKPADAPASASSPTSAEKKKPKKVWTDDNIGAAKGTISVVGDSSNASSPKSSDKPGAASNSADEAHQKQIENYRKQVQEYQDQIASIDKQIDKLKNFKADNSSSSGGLSMNQGYNMVPLDDQVKQLEDRKKQLQAKIDDTEIQARKDGIDPGDIR